MIRLDFTRTVPRPLRALRRGLLAAGLLATTSAYLWSNALQDRLDGLHWQQGTSAASPGQLRPTRADGAATQQTPQQREVLRELGVDWRGVFVAIEKSVTPEIRIMTIRPDPQRQVLQIEATAANGDQAQRFVDRLQTNDTIRDVHLVHEARDDGNERLAFGVRARWELP